MWNFHDSYTQRTGLTGDRLQPAQGWSRFRGDRESEGGSHAPAPGGSSGPWRGRSSAQTRRHRGCSAAPASGSPCGSSGGPAPRGALRSPARFPQREPHSQRPGPEEAPGPPPPDLSTAPLIPRLWPSFRENETQPGRTHRLRRPRGRRTAASSLVAALPPRESPPTRARWRRGQ